MYSLVRALSVKRLPQYRLFDLRIYLAVEVRRVACRRCGQVKQERLAFLADTPFYTKRFALQQIYRNRRRTLQNAIRPSPTTPM